MTVCMYERQIVRAYILTTGIPREQVCSCPPRSDSRLNIDCGFEDDSTRVTLKE